MTDGPKHAIYTSLAEVAQGLAHPHRLELLEHLAQGQRSVEDLAALSRLTFANTSRHLQLLRRARLVQTERRGKHVLYSLAGEPAVIALLSALGCVGERNVAEVRQVMTDYFKERDSLDPVSREELVTRVRDGLVTVLDVRSEEEFNLGHVPGALNVPLEQLAQRLSELPKQHEIIAYCRGPYCVMSFDAVTALREQGYRVRRLEDGFPEWKAAGLEIESTDPSAAPA